MDKIREKWDRWVAPVLTVIGLPADIGTAVTVIGAGVSVVMTVPALFAGIWAQLPTVTKVGWLIGAVLAGPPLLLKAGHRINRKLPWTGGGEEFPDINPHINVGARDYWPQTGNERFIIIPDLKIANNAGRDVNLWIRLRLMGLEGRGPFTFDPSAKPPTWDSRTARNLLPEIIEIEDGKVANGYVAYWVAPTLRQFMRVDDPDDDPRAFKYSLLIKDLNTGAEKEFEAGKFLMNHNR